MQRSPSSCANFSWAAMALIATLGAVHCASGFRPCSEGGDVSWPGINLKEMGDQYCLQTRGEGTRENKGPFLNEGRYRLYDKQGKVVVEGEFRKGQKHGAWTQFDPATGKRILEKFYDNGADITPPQKVSTVEKPEFSRMNSLSSPSPSPSGFSTLDSSQMVNPYSKP
ncbi:MAG: hypothetical protein JNL01_01925 [Bdellovibrionales bacterium]|nr:hypothetical protein [Bdellovibrionales bacterium]